jgi:hypothetical protein
MRYMILILGLLTTFSIFAAEEDDTTEGANYAAIGGDYQAILESATDIDFFRLSSVNQEGTLTITLSQEATGGDASIGWQLDLFSEDDLTQSLQSLSLLETELTKQTQLFITKGRYFLRVSSLSSATAPTQPYTLLLDLAVSAESNDIAETADGFSLNRTYREDLYAVADVDFFLLDSTDKEGELTLTIGHEEGDSNPNAGWRLELFPEGNLNQNLQTVTLTQAETTTQIKQPITKGKYVLKVSSLNSTLPTVRYTLKGSLAVVTEDNDTPKGADRTSANAKKTEALYFAGDLDFFYFSIREDRENPSRDTSGNLTVNLSQDTPPGANPKSGWRLDLYTENDFGNSLYTIVLPETSLSVEFEQGLSPGTYYYKVSSLDEEVFSTKRYTLKGTWEENVHYEKSPNEMPHTATAIKLNEAYFGNLSSAEDIDFYRFGLLNDDQITVYFEQNNPGADSAIGWEIGLYNEQDLDNPIQTAQIPITDLTAALQANLSTGVYYVRVTSIPPQIEETGNDSSANEEQPPEEPTIDAPIGKRYQIIANATNFSDTTLCPLSAVYAQNPVSQQWVAFPSTCEVPTGWNQTGTAPLGFEFCPSPYATFTADGLLTLPLVQASDEENNALGVFAVKLQQVPSEPNLPLQFEVMTDTLLFVKSP